ncbi:AsnC family protein [Streptomyces sp. NPDC014891]|uniref:AsnC family protein n=1 Tax=Streptomyces sp. NPDC014891 TaxID=3364929 RepID=UPI0036FD16DA
MGKGGIRTMGWATDDGRHEGYAVAVLADGRDATAADNPSGNSAWWCFDGRDGRPRAAGVRAACDCYLGSDQPRSDWRGTTVFPVDFEADFELTEGDNSSGPYAEWWNTHVTPAEATTVPGDVTDLLDQVRTRLAELTGQRPLATLTAVARLDRLTEAAARRAADTAYQRDATWSDIGAALGVSKQAAHQRLARHLTADDTTETP